MSGQPTLLRRQGRRAALACLLLQLLAREGQAEEACPTLRGLDTGAQRARLAAGEILVTLESEPDHKLKRGVALARVEAPAERVFEVVTDHQGFARFLPFVAQAEVRSPNPAAATDTSLVVYQLLDLPFPLSDRHYEVEIDRLAEAARCFESRWQYVPGSGNIDDTFGRWEVLADGDASTLLAYVVWVDPGGLIPAWAYNWASRRALPRLLTSVRDETARRLAVAIGANAH
jgi:hypothetical protein